MCTLECSSLAIGCMNIRRCTYLSWVKLRETREVHVVQNQVEKRNYYEIPTNRPVLKTKIYIIGKWMITTSVYFLEIII